MYTKPDTTNPHIEGEGVSSCCRFVDDCGDVRLLAIATYNRTPPIMQSPLLAGSLFSSKHNEVTDVMYEVSQSVEVSPYISACEWAIAWLVLTDIWTELSNA